MISGTPQASANTLGKPEKYISISYRYNEHLTFAGTLDPAFLLVIVRLIYLLWMADPTIIFLLDEFGQYHSREERGIQQGPLRTY